MANDFKMYATALTDTNETTLITATGSSIFIISSIIISNTHASTAADIDLIVTDTSEAADFNILTTENFLAGISREILSRPLVLENLDILKVQAATANIFDVLISFLDRSRD